MLLYFIVISLKQSEVPKLLSFSLSKITSIKSGQRVSSHFKQPLPICINTKFLRIRLKSHSGRGALGRIIFWTKKSLSFRRVTHSKNYKFRLSFISFVAVIAMEFARNKMFSLLVLSSGSLTYIPASYTHSIFKLVRMNKPEVKEKNVKRGVQELRGGINEFIPQSIFFIRQLPKNQHINSLELYPNDGIKYVRSPGSSAKMPKMDVFKHVALVKLPSGVRKIFSPFSIGSFGKTPNADNKYWKSNKAGYYSIKGKKPIVRGVARNPVDHPHGGRTKSIKYPQTP
jgi:ribosomal protein L2